MMGVVNRNTISPTQYTRSASQRKPQYLYSFGDVSLEQWNNTFWYSIVLFTPCLTASLNHAKRFIRQP
jgi:hypothetical protein